jgi:hypothetical protein
MPPLGALFSNKEGGVKKEKIVVLRKGKASFIGPRGFCCWGPYFPFM